MIEDSKTQDFHYLVGKIIAQCWLDKNLYNSLLQDPFRVLTQAGAVLDETVEIAIQPTQTGSGVEVEGNTLALKIKPQPEVITDLFLTLNDADGAVAPYNCRACCT